MSAVHRGKAKPSPSPFGVPSGGSHVDVLLSAGKVIERQVLETSLHMVDGLRPKGGDSGPVFGLGGEVAENPKSYTMTGFRESVTVEKALQTANERGVAFLADNKPAAAVGLLSHALKIAKENDRARPPRMCDRAELPQARRRSRAVSSGPGWVGEITGKC